jgi:hypothetical protein
VRIILKSSDTSVCSGISKYNRNHSRRNNENIPRDRNHSSNHRSGISKGVFNPCRNLQNVDKERVSEGINRMVGINPKRVRSSSNDSNDTNSNLHDHLLVLRRLPILYKSILKSIKKPLIPFSAISAALLTTKLETAKAETVKSIGEAAYQESKYAPPWFVDTVNKFKENGLVNTEAESAFAPQWFVDWLENNQSKATNIFDTWHSIGESITGIITWFQMLPHNIGRISIEVLAWIYDFLASTVLYTPLFLFKNDWFANTTMTFSMLSVSIVIILTIIESIKQMLGIKHTKYKDILKKFPIAVFGAGISPFAFEKVFELLNNLSNAITKIGYNGVRTDSSTLASTLTGLDTAALIGFDIVLIGLLVPIVLTCGRRWWDLLCLGALTPLSLSAWIFDKYRYIFDMWKENIKKLGQVQLIYSIFICLMGMFIFATPSISNSGTPYFMKFLVIVGGLWRMANPPAIVTRHADTGKDTLDMIQGIKDIVTLKGITNPVNKVKSKFLGVFNPAKLAKGAK